MAKEDLKIQIGTPVQLEFLTSRRKLRDQAKCIGFLRGESLLVTIPLEKGAPVPISEGEEVAVRYMDGESVCAFKSAVQKICSEPYPYIHLFYPSSVERVRVRKAERVSVHLDVKIKREGGGDERAMDAVLSDISAAGAGLQANCKLADIGDKCLLSANFQFADMSAQLDIPVIIRSVTTPEDNGAPVYQHGVEFSELNRSHQLFIRGFIYEQIINQRST